MPYSTQTKNQYHSVAKQTTYTQHSAVFGLVFRCKGRILVDLFILVKVIASIGRKPSSAQAFAAIGRV